MDIAVSKNRAEAVVSRFVRFVPIIRESPKRENTPVD
jgi:hypothetical protein